MTEPNRIPKPETKEKPAYETPLAMDLNKVQSAEGGIVICLAGSANVAICSVGAGFLT
jgi:hypothetical protein